MWDMVTRWWNSSFSSSPLLGKKKKKIQKTQKSRGLQPEHTNTYGHTEKRGALHQHGGAAESQDADSSCPQTSGR